MSLKFAFWMQLLALVIVTAKAAILGNGWDTAYFAFAATYFASVAAYNW